MTDVAPDLPAMLHPVPAQRSIVVIPRVHDGSGARTRYGLVQAELDPGGQMLIFPQGPVVDPDELRAGAAVLLEERIAMGDPGCRVTVHLGEPPAAVLPLVHAYRATAS